MSGIQVSARVGTLILAAARAAGADPETLATSAGFDPRSAADPDARIPLEVEEALWAQAARLTGDDAFGLHAAERLEPGSFGVADYALRSSATGAEALSRLSRYNRLVHDVAVLTVTDDPAGLRIEHTFNGASHRPSPHAAEFTLAAILTLGSQLSGAPLRARAVSFAHPRGQAGSEYRRVFGVEPSFSVPVSSLLLDRAFATVRVAGGDPGLARVLDRHAEDLLRALPTPSESLGSRARRALTEMLQAGEPTLGGLATRLKRSERTLQRHLAQEHLTFDGLLDDLRRDLALRYLASTDVSIAEVGWLLGYSEASAFHRSFKRWTQKTPAEHRALARRDPA